MDGLSDDQAKNLVDMVMELARRGDTSQLLDLIDHGVPVDVRDPAGNTALLLAAYSGQDATVRALIERGADVDLRNDRDQTPIAGALFKGEAEVVAALRAAGADLDAGTPSARAAAEMFGTGHLLA